MDEAKPVNYICPSCVGGRVAVWRRAILDGVETAHPEWKDCPICDGSGRIVDLGR